MKRILLLFFSLVTFVFAYNDSPSALSENTFGFIVDGSSSDEGNLLFNTTNSTECNSFNNNYALFAGQDCSDNSCQEHYLTDCSLNSYHNNHCSCHSVQYLYSICPSSMNMNSDGVCETGQGCHSGGNIPNTAVPDGWYYYGQIDNAAVCASKVDHVNFVDSLTYRMTCSQSAYCMLKMGDDFECPSGQNFDSNTSQCVPICPAGSVQNSSGTCCEVGNADTGYNVDQSTCESSTFVKIDNLTLLTNFSWNSCLGMCVAQSNTCPADKIFDSNGYCVPPTIDPAACQAQGGTLQNFSYSQVDTCIDNGGNAITPCCTYSAQCKDSSGNILSTPSVYVSCGDANQTTDNNSTTDLNNTTPTPADDNKCKTCPTQYPIANDQGSCENSQGDILMCPDIDYNTTTPAITCGTCASLGTGWTPDNTGMCKHTTVNGIIQYTSCPTSQNTDTTNTDINTTPETNSTFNDPNASINNTSENGDGTKNTCTCCPSGYKSISGQCAIVSSSGQILSIIACPCAPSKTDGNGTGPADNNGTEDNASNLLNGFGNGVEKQIKNAYKSYSFFNATDCGSLQASADTYLFNQPAAAIKDPLPMFVNILTPYRDMIKGFLMFIALVIGLFDFFKRS